MDTALTTDEFFWRNPETDLPRDHFGQPFQPSAALAASYQRVQDLAALLAEARREAARLEQQERTARLEVPRG